MRTAITIICLLRNELYFSDILWQENFGGSNIDVCFDAIELKDGKIIGVGETISNDKDILINRGFSDILIIKLK